MSHRSRFANRTLMLCLSAAVALMTCARAHAQESWDAIYLAGSKIGYVHTFVEKVKDRHRTYLRVRIDIEQRLKRDKDVTVTKLTYGTIETFDGQVLRLDTLTSAGEQQLRGHGDVLHGEMEFILEGAGQQQKLVIPWGPEVRGPYAAEQSMARKPMKENETRTLKMFIPTLNKICDIELRSRGIEPVILGDGKKRPLLRVEQTTRIDGKPRPEFDVKIWADGEGQVLKQEQDLLGGYIQYRTTREGALAEGGPLELDLIRATVIKVARKIPNAEKTRMAKYRITLKDGDLAEVMPKDARQTLQPEPNQASSILEVRSVGALDGEPGPANVDAQYLQPNALVTSQDNLVRRLAERATQGAVDPWAKAVRINHWVFENLKGQQNFKVGFAAASEVARNRTGDCSEHSVLAAAMERAAGIPSRVVIGLVYEAENLGGFGYHMWNEVYVNHRWVALDPTFDQSSVDAIHIKLSESSLEGVSPFEAFSLVVRVMGKLQIEPLEVQ